jgi:capsular polysaccharide biosynthesis protein
MSEAARDQANHSNPAITCGLLAWQAVKNQWKMVSCMIIIGIVIAGATSFWLGKQTWETTGTMLYTPLPTPDGQKGLYTSPDLNTLTSLIKSPDNLNELCEEFRLAMPLSVLDKSFKVTTPKNTQTVVVSLQWAEGTECARMTNWLMERFIERSKDIRRRTAEGHINDLTLRMTDNESQYKRQMSQYSSYLQKHNIIDTKLESESISKELETLLTDQIRSSRDEVSYTAQRVRVAKELEEIKRSVQEEFERERKFEASQETIADNRRRQDRLRELIDDERKRQEWIAELSVKRKEFDRRSALRANGVVSQAELDEIAKEVEILTARLNDNSKIVNWRNELTRIDQVVIPKGQSRSQGSPIIQQALFRQLEIDLKLIGIQKDLFEIGKAINAKRRRLEEISASVRESESMKKELEVISQDRLRLSEQASFFRKLRDQSVSEFSIVSHARAGTYPISSNRKLWFAGFMAGAFFVCCGWITYHETRRQIHSGYSVIRKTGIESLGFLSLDETNLRRFCTRFRDSAPNHGHVVMFTGDQSEAHSVWALHIARRLAQRDERIMILDCRLHDTKAQKVTHRLGLGDYLKFIPCDMDDLIVPDDSSTVDIIQTGSAVLPDSIATHRMSELLTTLKKQYTMIFVVGHSLEHDHEVDLLARHADTALAILGKQGRIDALVSTIRKLQTTLAGRIKVATHDFSTSII